MNIYELNGPEFLQVALAAQFVTTGLAFLARKIVLCYSNSESDLKRSFDHYEAAYLNGGTRHLFLTILAVLDHQGKVELNLTDKTVALRFAVDPKAHILERVVANALWKKHSSMNTVYERVKRSLEREQKNLMANGLVPSKEQAVLAAILPFQIIMAPVLFLDLPKLFIGISHHKPVAILLVLMFAAAGLALFLFTRESRRTAEGDRVLENWKREQSALKMNFSSFASNMSTKDLALAYALFAAFAFNLLSPYRQAVASTSGNNMWNYSPASCSSGSCGGASSGCGGGGGCGGGCGGCGGG